MCPYWPRFSTSSPALSNSISVAPSDCIHTSASASPPISPFQPPVNDNPSSAVTMVPPLLPVSPTRPVPPPASQLRKKNPLASPTVVFPPRESCSKYVGLVLSGTPLTKPLTLPLHLNSLAIMIPSIPEGGTKSRVETQVRVTVDLAYASATAGELPSQYDRVGSWKWLRLPKGTATKKRTRKEGKIGPFTFSLHLTLIDVLYRPIG